MKKVLLFLLLLLATSVSAQDVIVKKDGSTILSKVIEVGTVEVKYKKFSNQTGPIYSVMKSDIQAINYENGEKEVFMEPETSEPQPQQEFSYSFNNQVADGIAAGNRLQKERLMASAKSWHTIGNVVYWVCVIGGAVTGYLVYDDENKTPTWVALGGGLLAGFIGGGICWTIAKNKEEAANSIVSVPLYKQDFNLGNGRLSAGIDLMRDNIRRDQTLGLGLSLSF